MIIKTPLPGNPEQYKHSNFCKVCKSNLCYTLTDQCSRCFQIGLQVWIDDWGKADQGYPCELFPDSVPVAISQGVDWYAERNATACPKGPHLQAKHIKTGRCVGCTGDKNDPNRAKAKANGEAIYHHTFPCRSCATNIRKTSSNRCVKCNPAKPRERSEEQALMEDNPLTLFTYEEARAKDSKVYRTGERCSRGHKGWRYTSSRACIDCKNGVAETNREYSEEKRPEEVYLRNNNRTTLSRDVAVQLGYKLYKTNRPCKNHHVGFRRVVGGACVDCQRGIIAEDWNEPGEQLMRRDPNRIIRRELALTLGIKVYRTGEPLSCEHGLAWKYVDTSSCVECTKEGLRTAPKRN